MNEINKTPKKLAVINDFTGYGSCSQTTAIPVVSVMGIKACPVPTAIFSNHLAFPTWHKYDYTPHLKDYLSAWEKLNLHFNGILCGLLGNGAQAAILSPFIEKQKQDAKALFILDPIMGDHGKLYSSISPDYYKDILILLKYADIITPNLTEACILTGTPFPEELPDETFLSSMANQLHVMGPNRIVITGIEENGFFHNYISESYPTPVKTFYSTKAGGPSRPGTGDIFSAIIAADALNGVSLHDSVKKATDFIRICTKSSAAANIPINEGVCFEKYLNLLI